MALSDELTILQDLHQRGVLTDEEFSRAKARLLDEGSVPPIASSTPSPAVAAINAFRRSRSEGAEARRQRLMTSRFLRVAA